MDTFFNSTLKADVDPKHAIQRDDLGIATHSFSHINQTILVELLEVSVALVATVLSLLLTYPVFSYRSWKKTAN